ncbi:hypothetical protein LUZ63_006709 [Rhynchospora breviuscula]|uniref:Uncharacterized protein n=1 Tax=Rhynchospora breviuscula TaxID=2022672 RepID=A0A9Q0CR21_9POAL|nr:hypothetical protein LUZ63_006709 [Rhynchospora breviuscula]
MAVIVRPFLSPFLSFSHKALRWKATTATLLKHSKASAASIEKSKSKSKPKALVLEKRRTRSGVEVDLGLLRRYKDNNTPHLPVLLCEVLRCFQPLSLRSFVDCTVGAGSHSCAVIEAHEEMELYVGMDVDPAAHKLALPRFHDLVSNRTPKLNTYTQLTNFKNIKRVLHAIAIKDDSLVVSTGVDGIFIDLGVSSMQVDCSERGFSVLHDGPLDMRMDPQGSLKAEDILNSWPEDEIGRILRDFGEESNWMYLQKQIVTARASRPFNSTGQLLKLIRKNTTLSQGRKGWMKTATRVFQALRIAVNQELETLEDTLYSCFDCLAPGGRLAVISFHSLEDRIVKQTFLNLVNHGGRPNVNQHEDNDHHCKEDISEVEVEGDGETWFKDRVHGRYGTIMTKRPITPSLEEETFNPRCRSAKLRVLQKPSSPR